MTKLFDQGVEAARRLSPGEQDGLGRALLALTDERANLAEIEPEHLPHVLQGLADAERGAFATDEEVAAAFRSFDR